jgi:hypothetical protein
MDSEPTKLAVLIEKVKDICKDAETFITRIEFNGRVSPLEKIVYGAVSLVLVSVVGAIIALVLKK